MTAVKPTRDNIYVQRERPEQTEGGIIIPATFRAGKNGHSARLKMDATRDYFPAKVLAIGPEVRELKVGDSVLVWTWAEGDGSKLYAGENIGERDRMIIKPDDVLCAVDP